MQRLKFKKELNNALASMNLTNRKKSEVATINLFDKRLVINDYFFEGGTRQKNLMGLDRYRCKILSNDIFKAFLGE